MEYGLQLYSVRDAMAEDMEKTLAAVAAIGYKKVEFAGFFGHPAEEVAAWLKQYGLTVCSTHTPASELLPGCLAETIAYHKAIGNPFIIIPGYDASTPAKMDELVNLINEVQPKLEKEGIRLGYHNHHREFLPLYEGGYRIHDELYRRTNVALQIDTYWAYVAGCDPVALLEKEKDRVPVIHLKDGDLSHNGKSLGLGTAPVGEVYRTACRLGMNIVVESEGQDPDGISEVTRCFRYLKEAEKTV